MNSGISNTKEAFEMNMTSGTIEHAFIHKIISICSTYCRRKKFTFHVRRRRISIQVVQSNMLPNFFRFSMVWNLNTKHLQYPWQLLPHWSIGSIFQTQMLFFTIVSYFISCHSIIEVLNWMTSLGEIIFFSQYKLALTLFFLSCTTNGFPSLSFLVWLLDQLFHIYLR